MRKICKKRVHKKKAEKRKVYITVKADGNQTTVKYPMPKKLKVVVVINNQFTDAPNTTQIASGAGRSSAAGNNAAIDSSNTQQQQSVGAQGKAKNQGMKGKQSEPREKHESWKDEEEIVIVLNNQINLTGQTGSESAATQVASGGGTYSTSGTNSAVESSNTKQQHAVGGSKGAEASNEGMNSKQLERK